MLIILKWLVFNCWEKKSYDISSVYILGCICPESESWINDSGHFYSFQFYSVFITSYISSSAPVVSTTAKDPIIITVQFCTSRVLQSGALCRCCSWHDMSVQLCRFLLPWYISKKSQRFTRGRCCNSLKIWYFVGKTQACICFWFWLILLLNQCCCLGGDICHSGEYTGGYVCCNGKHKWMM